MCALALARGRRGRVGGRLKGAKSGEREGEREHLQRDAAWAKGRTVGGSAREEHSQREPVLGEKRSRRQPKSIIKLPPSPQLQRTLASIREAPSARRIGDTYDHESPNASATGARRFALRTPFKAEQLLKRDSSTLRSVSSLNLFLCSKGFSGARDTKKKMSCIRFTKFEV